MRLLRIACQTCVVLTLGLSFAHVLEFPGKLQLEGAEWLMVQHHLYVGFGTVGAAIEVLAIVLAWILALRLRGRPESRAALGAAVATTIGLIEWALVVAPMNARLNGWTAATLPPDWIAVRNRWEAGHAVQA
ncbi:MAG TPA: hypothetical protein VJ779_09545, partial [Acetobacteraceae bacterium]|nr:hypothetical protein [Acetobacteraceae bacterium]